MFISLFFTIAKVWKQPKCPSVDEWVKQLWGIYTVKYYLVLKEKKILPFATIWMGLESCFLNVVFIDIVPI